MAKLLENGSEGNYQNYSYITIDVNVQCCTRQNCWMVWKYAPSSTWKKHFMPFSRLDVRKITKKMFFEKFYLLQPFHEIFDQITEFLFGFFIVYFALLVKANFLCVPLKQKLFAENWLINKFFHECLSKFRTVWFILSYEIYNNSLQEMLNTDFTFGLD